MFGKMTLPCSPARQRKALRNYLECELEVRESDRSISERDLRDFEHMSDLLFAPLFSRIDRDVYYGRVVPKHGPGSTADGLSGNGKYHQETWTTRLEQAGLTAGENLLPNWRYFSQLSGVHFDEPGAETPVKVVLVPKTLKTPRVIAMEPTCMQYMQQAVLRSFLEHFYKDDFLVKVIGFDDQTPNQEMARQGSLDQRTATLDLSDASDRVSNQLVRAMLRRYPHLFAAVDATRSRRAFVRGHGVIRLAKYASMGSALCFPIEAVVFTTLIFMGIQRSLNTSLSRKDLNDLSGSVRIYGDDLIVPVDHVTSVVRMLEHFGARVGTSKSFWTGKFRESCGREYFNGHDVSITRVRQAFPTRRQDTSEVQSLVSLRNQLYMSGYWKTCEWLDDICRKLLRNNFPVVLPSSSVLGRVSFLGFETQKVHPSLHSPLVRGYVVKAKPPKDSLEGAAALLKCLLKLDTDAFLRDSIPWRLPDNEDEDSSLAAPLRSSLRVIPEVTSNHLEYSGRPKSFSMKLGWRSPL
jgi:hypothetical protein